MGLPVRFAAPDSQRQGRGGVSSGLPVRLTHQLVLQNIEN